MKQWRGPLAHVTAAIAQVPCLRVGSPFGVTQHVLVTERVASAKGSLRVNLAVS